MKLDKKGFMMAEVVVVSAVVLIFLASLYVSYNALYSKYKSRVTYYDSVALYQLAYYRDSLVDNHQIGTILQDAKNSGIKKIDDTGSDTSVFMIYNNKNNLTGNELNNIDNIHITYKDYIGYLSSSVDLTDSDYVMVMEKCNSENEDDCKYAYLKVHDGTVPGAPSSSDNPGNDDSYSYTGGTCYINQKKYSCYSGETTLSCNVGTIRYWSKNTCMYSGDVFYTETCVASCSFRCPGVDKVQYTNIYELKKERKCS